MLYFIDEATNKKASKDATERARSYKSKAAEIVKTKTHADRTMGHFTKMRIGLAKSGQRNNEERAKDFALRASVAGKLARNKKLTGEELLMKKKIYDEHIRTSLNEGLKTYNLAKVSKEERDGYTDLLTLSSGMRALGAAEKASLYK